ncbi:5505_t:CDS:2, partial [Ambispora gerdemannii]
MEISTSITNYFNNNDIDNERKTNVNSYFSLELLREIFLYSVNQTGDDQLTVTRLKSWLDQVDIASEKVFDLVYQERFQPAYGIGTKPDPRKGFYWYQKSALGGNNTGMFNLANCYQFQWATLQDMHQALKWYRLSEKNGNESATREID